MSNTVRHTRQGMCGAKGAVAESAFWQKGAWLWGIISALLSLFLLRRAIKINLLLKVSVRVSMYIWEQDFGSRYRGYFLF